MSDGVTILDRKPEIDIRHMAICPCCGDLLCLRCLQLDAFMDNMLEAQEWSALDRRAYKRAHATYKKHRAERDHRFFHPAEHA